MVAFSDTDLANMKLTQEGHMMDTCVLQAAVQTADTYNQLVETWPADADAISCGLDMRPGSERHGIDNTVINYDATVRLPFATAPDLKDRVKITKRFGTALAAPLEYDIVGPIQKGPSGVRLLLKIIET